MFINKAFISGIIDDLTSKKLYRNERQLQLDIACEIKKELHNKQITDWRVEMEYLAATVTLPAGKANNYYIDIMLISDKGEFIPIELKYKTKAIPGVLPELKTHGAQDCGRYDFLWDVCRIESLKSGSIKMNDELKTYISGYAVMVTNDHLYYNKTSSGFSGVKPAYADFCIGHGQIIKAGKALAWKPLQKTAGWRAAPITLSNTYTCDWHCLSGKSKDFKRLIFNI